MNLFIRSHKKRETGEIRWLCNPSYGTTPTNSLPWEYIVFKACHTSTLKCARLDWNHIHALILGGNLLQLWRSSTSQRSMPAISLTINHVRYVHALYHKKNCLVTLAKSYNSPYKICELYIIIYISYTIVYIFKVKCFKMYSNIIALRLSFQVAMHLNWPENIL